MSFSIPTCLPASPPASGRVGSAGKCLFKSVAFAATCALAISAAQAQVLASVAASAAPAQVSVAAAPQTVEASTRQWLDAEVAHAQQPDGVALRMEVEVGALDSRLRLAPCAQVEPYLPPGQRLWGKTRLGLRCVEGAVRWNVFLPVTVHAYGPGWIARGPIPAGVPLTQDDAVESEVDWADEYSRVLSDPAQWVGSVTTRMLKPGQPLRQSSVRAPQVFQPGMQVRIVAQGPGFAVTADGQAVTAGVIGQPVRVRMEGGRMMTGTVVDSHTVRIDI
jgi:flagella basal body P-ring formation protein FlgA